MTKAVIFDLDGVLTSTDEFHFRAWAKLAEEEGIAFNREMNEQFRGVSRKDCLDILIDGSRKKFSSQQKEEMLARKNSYYRDMLGDLGLSGVFPGVTEIMSGLKRRGVKIAIGSSSKNTKLILERIGLDKAFDAVVDGCQITNGKPHPEVFLLAAEKLGVEPGECLVVEDAAAGVEAALAAGMQVIGVGPAMNDPRVKYGLEKLTPALLRDFEIAV